MSFKAWDVDTYKTDHESEEHWELRKKFMETYKDKFEEDELVCLAQVFVNVEFLGCKYPDETMKLVGELSQEVANEFRKERAGKLKRTFVKASDAAEQKAKGKRTKNTLEGNTFSLTAILKNTKISDKSDSDEDVERPSFSGAKQITNNPRLLNNYWSPLNTKQNLSENNQTVDAFFNHFKVSSSNEQYRNYKVDLYSGLKFGKFILILTGDRSSIFSSAKKCGYKYEEREKVNEVGEKTCELRLNNKQVAFATGVSNKIAKKLAFDKAMEIFAKECFTIRTKTNPEKINISRNNETITANILVSSESSKIDSNNIGYKIMQKFGWTGGALGLRTKGREDPIDCLTIKNNRKGLGNDSNDINGVYFKKLLKNYIDSEDIRDLHFDSCFTKDERAKLHQIATSKNLKSSSYGRGMERYLVISKKTISPENILEEILINNNKMYIDKYEVRVPVCKRNDFPNYISFESEEISQE